MLQDTVHTQIVAAMKAHEEVKLSTLKLLSSALAYEKIAKQHELTEDEELVVVKKEAKKRKDSIEAYQNAGRQELADREKQELVILQEYLPQELGDEEIEKLVTQALQETGATSMADMGKVIGLVMQKSKGQADGAKVSALIRQKLS
ncbi:MAG: GatB/YqeY domain-containing protein [Patescibacteria group bacterium]